MKWLNKVILQNVEGNRGNNWYIGTSKKHDEDCRRNKYNNYGDGENDSEG